VHSTLSTAQSTATVIASIAPRTANVAAAPTANIATTVIAASCTAVWPSPASIVAIPVTIVSAATSSTALVLPGGRACLHDGSDADGRRLCGRLHTRCAEFNHQGFC